MNTFKIGDTVLTKEGLAIIHKIILEYGTENIYNYGLDFHDHPEYRHFFWYVSAMTNDPFEILRYKIKKI